MRPISVSKRIAYPDRTISVDADCPWCDCHQTGLGTYVSVLPDEVWAVLACASSSCRRAFLIRIPLAGTIPWPSLDIDEPSLRNAWGQPEIYPRPTPQYQDQGVPDPIRRDFEEALQCFAAGHVFGAALVGRRVLQAAVRNSGGTGPNLKAEIDSLSQEKLGPLLKAAAHEVRLVGNEAAHAEEISIDDGDALLEFTRDVLEALYTLPFRIAARKKASASAQGR